MTLYLHVNFGEWSGISFVDSTRGRVCDNKRISSHRVFREHAACSKTSMGWFYGFKLHLIINEKGDLLEFEVSPGNTDDRQPLWELSGDVFFGSLIGDKGYISKDLREHLSEAGINWVYKVRKSMKPYNRHYSRQQTGTHQSLSSPLLMTHPRRNGNARLHAKGRNSSLGISPKRCIFNSSSLGLRRIRVFKTYWVMPRICSLNSTIRNRLHKMKKIASKTNAPARIPPQARLLKRVDCVSNIKSGYIAQHRKPFRFLYGLSQIGVLLTHRCHDFPQEL